MEVGTGDGVGTVGSLILLDLVVGIFLILFVITLFEKEFDFAEPRLLILLNLVAAIRPDNDTLVGVILLVRRGLILDIHIFYKDLFL